MGSKCQLTGNELKIELGTAPTIMPNSKLQLLRGVQQRGAAAPSPFTGAITVGAPENSVVVVNLNGPSQVGSCDDVKLQFVTAGLGGRAPVVTWTVAVSQDTTLATTQQELSDADVNKTAIVSVLASQRFTVNSRYFISGVRYTITVQVQNFIGTTANDTVSFVKLRENKPVSITLTGPSDISADVTDMRLSGSITASFCGQVATNFFSTWYWELLAGDPTGIDFSDFNPGGVTKYGKPNLVLKRKLRTGGSGFRGGMTYTVKVTAKMNDDATKADSAVLTVKVASTPLAVKLSVPRVVQSSNVITGSVAVVDNDYSPDPVTVKIVCQLYDDSTSGANQLMLPCIVNGAELQIATVDNGDGTYAFSIGAASLTVKKKYLLTATASKGLSTLRKTSDAANVEVIAGTPPEVKIISTFSGRQKATERLVITAQVKVTRPVSGQFQSIGTASNKVYGTVDLTNTPTRSFSIQPGNDPKVSLVVDASLLKVATTYLFRVSAHFDGEEENSAYDEIEITTFGPPIGGSLKVLDDSTGLEASSGTALLTTFRFKADGFTDPDDPNNPLTYLYSVCYNCANDPTNADIMSQLTKSAYGIAKQDATEVTHGISGSNDGQPIKARVSVTVATSGGASRTLLSVELTINALTASNVGAAVANVESQLSNALQGGDASSCANLVGTALKLLLVASNSSNDSTGSAAKAAVYEDYVKTGIQSGIDARNDDAATTATKISGYADVVPSLGAAKGGLDSSTVSAISDCVDSVNAAKKGTSSGTSTRSKRAVATTTISGYSQDEGTAVLRLLESQISSANTTSAMATAAKHYLDIMYSVMQGFCVGMVEGDMKTVSHTYSTFKSFRPTQSTVGTTSINLTASEKIVPGASVQSNYTEYSCSTGTCHGLCVSTGTLKQTDDLVTKSLRGIIPSGTLASNIQYMRLFATEQPYDQLKPTLVIPITITIQGSALSAVSKTYECRRWVDDDSTGWSTDGCIAVNITSNMVKCQCNQPGFFSLYEVDKPPEPTTTTPEPTTTTASTTTAATTTTTAGVIIPQNGGNSSSNATSGNTTSSSASATTTTVTGTTVTGTTTTGTTTTTASTASATTTTIPYSEAGKQRVQFKLDLNYNDVVGSDAQHVQSVKETVQSQLASTLNIPASRITNIELKPGSILIEFDILAAPAGIAQPSVDALVSVVKNLETTSFSMSLPTVAGGFATASVMPGSAKTIALNTAPNNNVPVIVSASVGGAVFVVLVILAVLCATSKKQKGSVDMPMTRSAGDHEQARPPARVEPIHHDVQPAAPPPPPARVLYPHVPKSASSNNEGRMTPVTPRTHAHLHDEDEIFLNRPDTASRGTRKATSHAGDTVEH